MTDNEIREKFPKKIPAIEVAKDMGISFVSLAKGINRGTLPFGANIGVEGGQNHFYIATERYLAWKSGQDMAKVEIAEEKPQNDVAELLAEYFGNIAAARR